MAIYNAQFGSGFMPIAGGLEALAQGAAEYHSPEAMAWRQTREDPSLYFDLHSGDWNRGVPKHIRDRWEAVVNPNFDPSKGPGEGNMPVFFQDKTNPDRPTPPWAQGAEGIQALGPLQRILESVLGQGQGQQGGAPPPAGPLPPPRMMPEGMPSHYPPDMAGAIPQQAPQQTGGQQPPHFPQNPSMGMGGMDEGLSGLLMQILLQSMQQSQQQAPMAGGGSPAAAFEQGGKVDKKLKAVNDFAALLDLDRGEVPIVAHEGEYVLRKEAVDSLGKDFLDRINNAGENLPRMGLGGPVGGFASSEGQRVAIQRLTDEDLQRMLQSENPPFSREILQAESQRRNPPTSMAPHTISSGEPNPFLPQGEIPSRGEQFINREREGFRELGSDVKDIVTNQLPDSMRTLSDHIMQTLSGENTKDFFEEFGEQYRYYSPPGRPDNPPGTPPEPVDAITRAAEQVGPGIAGTPQPPAPAPAPAPAPRPEVSGERRVPPTTPSDTPTPATPTPPEPDTAPAVEPAEEPTKYYMRAANVAMPLDWENIAKMEPGEAYQHLQTIANTQAPWHNVPLDALRGGPSMPAQHKLFHHLTDVYDSMHGITTENIERQLRKAESEQRQQLTNFTLQKLAEEAPYFGRLAGLASQEAAANVAISEMQLKELELTLPYLTQELDTRLEYMRAQTEHLRTQTGAMQGGIPLIETPEDMLKFASSVHQLRDRLTTAAKDAAQHALQLFEDNNKSEAASEAFHRAHLRYLLLSGIIPAGTKYDEAREQGFMRVRGGLGSGSQEVNFPTQDIYDEVMADYVTRHDNLFRAADAFTDRSGMGAMLYMGLAQSGVDWNSFFNEPVTEGP